MTGPPSAYSDGTVASSDQPVPLQAHASMERLTLSCPTRTSSFSAASKARSPAAYAGSAGVAGRRRHVVPVQLQGRGVEVLSENQRRGTMTDAEREIMFGKTQFAVR